MRTNDETTKVVNMYYTYTCGKGLAEGQPGPALAERTSDPAQPTGTPGQGSKNIIKLKTYCTIRIELAFCFFFLL